MNWGKQERKSERMSENKQGKKKSSKNMPQKYPPEETVSQKIIRKIAKKYGLSLILFFGSHISRKIHPNSDLDIAVMAKRDFDYENYSSLLFDLSRIFPSKEIDLVFLNRANPLLLKKILENCKIIYGRERRLNLLKIYSFKRFCDYKKYFDLEEKFIHKFLYSL